MLRYILTALACFALATAFSIAPIGIQDASITLDAKTALAQPGGKGKGKGHGKGKGGGQARGHGNTNTLNGVANGYSGDKSSNGRALGHEIDGVSGVGPATAPGQAKKAGYEGMYDRSEIKGSFNAINASKRAFEVSSSSSRVQRVKDYLDAIQAVSDAGDAVTDQELEDAADAAAIASSQTVTAGMLDEVNAISDDKELTEPGMINPLDQGTTEDIAERAND